MPRRRAGGSRFVLTHSSAGRMGELFDWLRLAAQFLPAYGAIDDRVVMPRRRAGGSRFVLTDSRAGHVCKSWEFHVRLSANFSIGIVQRNSELFSRVGFCGLYAEFLSIPRSSPFFFMRLFVLDQLLPAD